MAHRLAASTDTDDIGEERHYRYCVYTIVNRDRLDTAATARSPLVQPEGKRWVTAEKYREAANREGTRVPVVLADARDCSRLLYWGWLADLDLRPSSTRYTVDRLRPIHAHHAPQELVLVGTGRHIDPGFIRPYALCRTPSFLSESPAPVFVSPEESTLPETYPEGASVRVGVNAYERSHAARRRCLEEHGHACAVCDFDFERAYGELGRGFIHVHHLRPLSEVGEGYEVDPVLDLKPVCPNCHAMLHARHPAVPIEELRALRQG